MKKDLEDFIFYNHGHVLSWSKKNDQVMSKYSRSLHKVDPYYFYKNPPKSKLLQPYYRLLPFHDHLFSYSQKN